MWVNKEEYETIKKMVLRHEDEIIDLRYQLKIQKDYFDLFKFKVENPPKYEVGYQNKNLLITGRRIGTFIHNRIIGDYTERYWEYQIFDSKLKTVHSFAKESELFK